MCKETEENMIISNNKNLSASAYLANYYHPRNTEQKLSRPVQIHFEGKTSSSVSGFSKVFNKYRSRIVSKLQQNTASFSLLRLLCLPLTSHDTFKVIKTRFLQAVYELIATPTIKHTNRDNLRQNIATHLYKSGLPKSTVKKEKQAFIVMGMNGSGKSTKLIPKLQDIHGAVVIDNDYMMSKFPEYRNGIGLNVIAKERDIIARKVLQEAIERGENIIKPNCALTEERFFETYKMFKDKGYTVHLRFIDINPDEAANRAVKRFSEKGNYTDPLIHQMQGKKPLKIFENVIKNKKMFETYAMYSNDVAENEKLKFIQKFSSINKTEV